MWRTWVELSQEVFTAGSSKEKSCACNFTNSGLTQQSTKYSANRNAYFVKSCRNIKPLWPITHTQKIKIKNTGNSRGAASYTALANVVKHSVPVITYKQL